MKEEGLSITLNTINNQVTQIILKIKAFQDTSTLSLSNQSIILSKINEEIDSLISHQITNLPKRMIGPKDEKTSTDNDYSNHKVFSIKKEITNLQSYLEDNQFKNKDSSLQKFKKKLKEADRLHKLKEYQYLSLINDQTKELKELQAQALHYYPQTELKKIKLFPHLKPLADLNNDSSYGSSCNSKRLSSSRNNQSNHVNCNSLNLKQGGLESNDDLPYDNRDKNTSLTERSKNNNEDIEKQFISQREKHDITKNVEKYQLYQKNKGIKYSKNYIVNSHIKDITFLIDNHNKKHASPLKIKNNFKKPIQTYYGSYQKVV